MKRLNTMDNQSKELDTIIIGSGSGGLSAAICLARAGQKVLVLEQHDVPGGWCHSFYLNGHRFSPGVHYLGLLGEGESTSDLYKGLGIANDLVFFRMNPKGYEHCLIGDERIDIPADFDKLSKSLSRRFPKEKKGISKYLRTVLNVSNQLQLIPKMDGFWDNLTIPWRTRHLGKYGLFSLRRVIDWHLKDPLLKKVLNIQCADYGLPPSRASFPLHCAVMEHYSKGGFYPMGGGAAIVKAMTKVIKRYGSKIQTKASVRRILTKGNKQKRAVGVELASGEKVFAKRIISNADPNQTYLNLVGANNISKKLLKQLDQTKYSCTSLILFLIVDMDVRKAGLDSGNIWIMPDRDMDELFHSMMTTDISAGNEFQGLFVSCTTLKDPTSFDGRYHAIEAITFINYESFAKYRNEGIERSPEYLQFKDRLVEKIINQIEKIVPGITDKIVHKELGTPITNEFYISSTNGSVYGTEKSFMQTGPFAYKSKSEIDNLFLCGASIMSHGVAGASYSGVQTAANILGCKQEDLLKPDESQDLLILDAEESTEYPQWINRKMEVRRAKTAQPV